jgi:hypothetical protein
MALAAEQLRRAGTAAGADPPRSAGSRRGEWPRLAADASSATGSSAPFCAAPAGTAASLPSPPRVRFRVIARRLGNLSACSAAYERAGASVAHETTRLARSFRSSCRGGEEDHQKPRLGSAALLKSRFPKIKKNSTLGWRYQKLEFEFAQIGGTHFCCDDRAAPP